MKIFTSSAVRQIDEYTIQHEPVHSVDLMERAAGAFVKRFTELYDVSSRVLVFAGPGNNGGDALAVARMLHLMAYSVETYLLNLSGSMSPDCEINYKRLTELPAAKLIELESISMLPEIHAEDIVIDGIFGSGLTRPVSGIAAEVIQYINHSKPVIVAIDVPSGLYGENNTGNNEENIIQAHLTLTFQFPFISFFFAENYRFTGHVEVLDIGLHPAAINEIPSSCFTIDENAVFPVLKPREKYSHKGTYGHALLIGGSYGMMGAQVLAVKACLRGGAGLVTARVPKFGNEIIQITAPEALVSIDESDLIFTGFPDLSQFSAVGIGPGLGCKNNSCKGLKTLLEECKVPLVLDADALNILAENPAWFSLIPKNTLLTPHPGEFDRLAGKSASMYERYQKQLALALKYKINIILKGAHSIVVTADGETWFNTSGNPGMATGGSGDVLTGLLVSLLAQGYKPAEAARAGVFLHGLAGDLACREVGEEGLVASDIVDYLGKAFVKVREGGR